MTPSQVGERAEAAVVAALVHAGKSVYLPFGASGRCDLIYADEAVLHRTQVKNGVLRNGVVRFPTCSNTKNSPVDYRRDVDDFGVYCHELASVFVVPVAVVPLRAAYLRVGAPRSQQQRGIRWAEQFRIDWSPARLDADPQLATDADPA